MATRARNDGPSNPVYLVDTEGVPVGTATGPIVIDTELPAAAALADGMANPTTPLIGSALLAFNGSTWHRVYLALAPGNSDGVAGNVSNGLDVRAGMHAFNGATWDRQRNNHELTLLASAARTATVSSVDQTNYNCRGVVIFIDVTAIAATPSVTFTIEGKSSLSAEYYTILTSAAVVATGNTVLRAYPGLTAAANTVANDVLPRIWRVTATHGDADSITYSVSANLIV